MHASELSELLWEVCESLYESRGECITIFGSDLMQTRFSLYSSSISEEGARLKIVSASLIAQILQWKDRGAIPSLAECPFGTQKVPLPSVSNHNDTRWADILS